MEVSSSELRVSRAVGNEPKNELSNPFDNEEETTPVIPDPPKAQKSEPAPQPRVFQKPQQNDGQPRQQQQFPRRPRTEQPVTNPRISDPNNLYDFKKGCSIGNRAQDNRLGIEQSGSIFTFTSHDLAGYFERYFEFHNHTNIYFGDGSAKLNDLPAMYLIFPKMEGLVVNGRSANDIETKLLGGKARGAHIRLNEKLKELVKPFVDPSKLVVYESQKRDKSGRPFCYIELDPDAVLSTMFLKNKNYRVILLDTAQQGSNVLYRVARLRESGNGGYEIRDIIEHITR